MKYLQTDERTIADLSIFGTPGKPGIFELYNRTVTQGANKKMIELFRQPLADEQEINRRSALYRFFSLKEYVFPVDSMTMAAVAYYMENDDTRSRLRQDGETTVQKLRQLLVADAHYVFVEEGVQACLRIVRDLTIFLQVTGSKIAGTPFEEDHKAFILLLRSPVFAAITSYSDDRQQKKLSAGRLAEWDQSLRFDHREVILELLSFLYDLDICICIGQTARQHGFQFAHALPADSNILDYKGVFHPLVQRAIPNDLHLDSDHNVLFLTGANMAGKSTLMKSIGLALYLAHMGFPVAAEKLQFAVRDGIYTTINLPDDLTGGASHYYTEVLRVKEVAVALKAGARLLVIFDELFRGTNVKDAQDATVAIIRAFSRKSTTQFIISTHIMEAGEILRLELLSIGYQYLPTEMCGNTPHYTRILREGITDDRHGMLIIKNEGILELLDKGLERYYSACNKKEPCHLEPTNKP